MSSTPALVAPWIADAGGVAGAFAAGCMAGSFLNVVAHRVPRGETVIFGRSRCPACGATVRARDNVPVLGWLLLRGRCRDCHAAISPGYPVVEAACGGIAAVLAAAELALAPGAAPAAVAAAWTGRTTLALTIVGWALLAARGHVVTAWTVGAAAAAATLAASCVASLAPLPVGCTESAWATATGWRATLLASAAGAMAGRLTGLGGGRPARGACLTIGAALGWQAALVAAAAAAVGNSIWKHPAAACLATLAAVVCRHPLARAWEAVCRCLAG